MIDVDARGRHEAELLREEAARIADTETALQSVLDGEVLVPLVTRGEARSRRVVARDPVSVRRRIPVLVGVAAAAAVVAAIAFLPSSDPKVITPADTTVTPSTELVVQPLDPPIECELELCPSLAVSPEGTLVAYDQTAKTLTWYDAEPHVLPVTADLGAEQVQLEALGPNGIAYLLTGSPDTQSWQLVMIAQSGAELRRSTSSSPDVEPYADGFRERLYWTGCEPATHPLMGWQVSPMPYPGIAYTTGVVTVEYGMEWKVAWPHTLSTRSQVAPRWDGGAVLSLIPESVDAPRELIELLPDGSVQRFDFGDETVHALLPDGSAVVWRDGQFVRLSPPQALEWPGATELTVQTLEPPMTCDRSPMVACPSLAVSPDGTLVALDMRAQTLTWYEDEPRVIPLKAERPLGVDEGLDLIAIGPHDIAYIQGADMDSTTYIMAVAPSGTEITRVDWRPTFGPVFPTATGLVRPSFGDREWPPPDAVLAMPWVDLDGNPITDTRPYPTAKDTGAGIEVRLGERRWLLAGEASSGGPLPFAFFLPRSDGGVVALDFLGELLELLPDGTIEHYDIGDLPVASLPVLPDGSLIVIHNLQLLRFAPRA